MISIENLLELGYLVAAALFIFGIKGLGSPRTAVRGNQLGSIGMLIAVIATVIMIQRGGNGGDSPTQWTWVLIGLGAGALVGAVMAKRVEMTGMPEMVALLNGFGGAASALVGLSELLRLGPQVLIWDQADAGSDYHLWRTVLVVAVGASSLIGWLTLTGSVVAMLKLAGKWKWNLAFGGVNLIKGGLLLLAVVSSGMLLQDPTQMLWIGLLTGSSALLGVIFVAPIGGADMPVVISFLNSLSGLAATATGFVVGNNALIISGALVGAAGLILTAIMCKAMNRSFLDVMFKAYGASSAGASGDGEKRSARGYDADEAALAFDGARLVIVVPGYGMAVSQAQHAVRELAEELEAKGTDVRYAIHPVAGRMPGHMNVLLAEANVSYDKLYELDDINSAFSECDVALIVGANDTINPAAHTDPGGPLGGMPILDVEKARTTIIVKRSLSPGYAGVDNDLFYRTSTMMLFGDGKKKIVELLGAVKEL
jgi:NAD(P) transhydrogenase subunit beta